MDYLQLIASIVDSLAWPVVFMWCAFIFRESIVALLEKLTHLQWGNLKLNFGRELQELEDKAEAAGLDVSEDMPRAEQGVQDSAQIVAEAMRLASEFQGSAVVLAWTAVEQELMQAVMRLAISPDYPPYNSAIKNIQLLHEQGYLDADNRGLLERMRRLRNAAAHPSRGITEISADDARKFVALTEAITDRIKSLKR